jgi:peptide/nickel transport system ATP-binding protein
MEYAPAEEIFENPLHPYTHILLAAVPDPEALKKPAVAILESEHPVSAMELPEGCRFQVKCTEKNDRCRQFGGELIPVGKDHFVRCGKA